MGDIWAQVAALDVMEARVAQLLADYALPDPVELARQIHGRSERAMRDTIRRLPDGIYYYDVQTYGMELQVALKVADGAIEADYVGTTAQQPCAISCPLTYTYAMTAYAVRCALLPCGAPDRRDAALAERDAAQGYAAADA